MNSYKFPNKDIFDFNVLEQDNKLHEASQATFYDCKLKMSVGKFKKGTKFECIDVDFNKEFIILYDNDGEDLYTVNFSDIKGLK
jgi:hypothetical protein